MTPGSETTNLYELMPFTKMLGMDLVTNHAEQVRARLKWSDSLCTSGGILHGGVIMSLADSTGALCAFHNLPDGATGTTTIESKTNFLRAVRTGGAESTSRPLHVGRSVIVIETDVTDAERRLVARVMQSQAVLR